MYRVPGHCLRSQLSTEVLSLHEHSVNVSGPGIIKLGVYTCSFKVVEYVHVCVARVCTISFHIQFTNDVMLNLT